MFKNLQILLFALVAVFSFGRSFAVNQTVEESIILWNSTVVYQKSSILLALLTENDRTNLPEKNASDRELKKIGKQIAAQFAANLGAIAAREFSTFFRQLSISLVEYAKSVQAKDVKKQEKYEIAIYHAVDEFGFFIQRRFNVNFEKFSRSLLAYQNNLIEIAQFIGNINFNFTVDQTSLFNDLNRAEERCIKAALVLGKVLGHTLVRNAAL